MARLNEKRVKQLFTLMVVMLLLPILAHFALGLHNRALADDFCFTVNAQAKGLSGTLDWYYNNWQGTYSTTFFQSVIGLAQAWRYTPIILIGLFSLACLWVAYQVVRTFHLTYRWHTTGLLGLVLTFGVLSGTANVFQSFYWTSGGITYAAPLTIFLFYIGLLVIFFSQQTPFRWWQYLLAAGLPLLSGGFSPLYAVFQVAAYGLLFLLVLRFAPSERKRRYATLVIVSLAFAMIALLILLVAPGNATRQASFDKLLPLPQAIMQTLIITSSFIPVAVARLSLLAVLSSFFLAGFVAFYCHPLPVPQRDYVNHSSLKWLGLSGMVGYLLMAAAFFTSLYSIGQLPPARAYVIPQTVLVVLVMSWGYIMGLGLQKKYAPAQPSGELPSRVVIAAMTLTAIIVAGYLTKTFPLLPDFRVYAAEWDARDAYLKTVDANGAVLEIPAFTKDLADYVWLDDPYLSCIRDYYHQPTLVILEKADDTGAH
ncbi:MAG: hypothetical protein H6672_01285 [Anaerolineaceae bacterium]|nr:hypothetical protein [Anaerolineaceae bacterium]